MSKLNRPALTKTHRIVRKMLEGRGAPHLIEISECLVREFGGVQEFVKEMYSQYKASPAAHKGAWMRAFVRIVESTTEMGIADRDLGQLTDKDLERELIRLFKGQGTLPNVVD